MSALQELLLTTLLNHGAAVLGSVLWLAAMGVPLPATMLLMAAGAFVQQGVLAPATTAAVALIGAVAGDAGSYLVGRLGATRLPDRLRRSAPWLRAAALFERWGMWGVFVTRFLFTPLALPVNLLAGSTRYAWHRFMAAVIAGEIAWVALFGGLGYLFADRWEALSGLAGDAALAAVGGALAVWGLVRTIRSRGDRGRRRAGTADRETQ
jgi:membrane-associated protein